MLVDVHGSAHPDLVWRRFSTPSLWSSWAPQIRRVDTDADRVGLRVGDRGRVVGPGGLSVDYRITGVDPALRSWSWHVGRGPARIEMHHHVLPAADGGTRALLQVDGPAAVVAQPYRLVAGLALRNLVGAPAPGDADDRAVPSESVERFDFAFAPSYAAAGRPFGVTPANSSVEVGPRWLYVRYGPWRLVTPRTNVADASVTGDFRFVRTAGPPHLSFTDRGVSFTPNGDRALCVQFHQPVAAIDTTGAITHPGATLGVAEPERLAAALDQEA